MKWTAWPTRPVGRVHSCETGWRAGVTRWPCYCRVRLAGHCRFCQREKHLVHSLDRCWEMCVFMAGFLSIYFCLNNEEHVTLVSSLSRSRAGSWPIPDVARAICSRRCETQRIFYKLWYYVLSLFPSIFCPLPSSWFLLFFFSSFFLSLHLWVECLAMIYAIYLFWYVLFISGCEQCDRSLMVTFSWRTDKLIITNFFSFFFSFFALCKWRTYLKHSRKRHESF